jgi:hypothetical protein
MELDQISTIEDWPTLISVRYLQVLPEFTNFYRTFICDYEKVTVPLTELREKSETNFSKESGGLAKWEWTWGGKLAFQKLKRNFTEALFLQHFDQDKPIILHTDASGFTIAAITNQYHVLVVPRPFNIYFRKSSPA